MCDKAVDTYPSTTEYVPDQFRTQEMCDKALDKCPFGFDSVPDQFKTHECMTKFFLKIKLKYSHDRYKTQRNV